ncbi:MAG TPA: energy transducer TonB [Vicinamibacterales bacterium]|nr:energy transducer TonB [Vicinamibacterales bacterium]
MIAALFLVGVGLVPGQARPADAAVGDLAAAKALYASASYEEALSRLSTVRGPDELDQIEEYRALCLLALGRSKEAERAIERIVERKPLYMSSEDTSPRLLAILHDVRKRLLPAAARRVYARAKADYEEKNYPAAIDGFKELLAIVSDPDTVDARAGLSDLKQLGEGFLKLATAEAAAATKAAPQPAPATTPASSKAPAIYSADDLDVTPPAEIRRLMPAWTPSLPTQARLEFRGTLEVVVDETGQVSSAAIRRATTPGYDAALLEAAKTWRYRPATRHGVPVRYRTFIDVFLKPGGPASR